jgi:DNA invertase Pin-like site-specific DNA recombinase
MQRPTATAYARFSNAQQAKPDSDDRQERVCRQRRTAISYARFSDPKQARGDSEGRQDRDFRRFCQQHNLTPLSEVYADRGRSGYRDEHRKKGRLGQLIAAAKGGSFERGSIIVIEAWDRLGRLRPDKQTDLVAELLRTGVDIGICQLNDIFTEEDFGTHKWAILSTFIMLAFQESKQKSERVAASYAKRREQARESGKPMTGRVPAWLRIVNGEFVPIPERVAAFRRVFELSAAGYGQARIIRTLNKEGHAPMGRSKNGWGHSYIQLILTDRRALGELTMVDGTVLPSYYPRIVSDDLFALANKADSGQEDAIGRKSGPRDRKWVNTFQGLLVNALDGEGFFIHKKRSHLMLEGAGGANGRGKSQTFPYDVFEEAILGQLREVNPADVLPTPETDKPKTVDVLRAKLANIRADIAGLQADLKQAYSRALAAVLREKEAEEEQTAGALQDELAASVRPADKAWEELPSLVDLIREQGDEARLRIRGVLRSIVQEARVLLVRRASYTLAGVQVYFTGGAVRHYLVVYRTACPGRPRSWWCRSLASVANPADLDLRRREDAAALAEVLAEVNLAELE